MLALRGLRTVAVLAGMLVALTGLAVSRATPAHADSSAATVRCPALSNLLYGPLPAVSLPPTGSFVRAGGSVYVVVSCALVYVPSWSTYHGPHPTIALTDQQFSDASRRPVPDGTFVRSAPDGHVYRVVSGAPVYVSTWAPFGGPQPAAIVDQRVIAGAGLGFQPHPQYRFGGVFVRSAQDGRVYSIAEGAPVYVTTWSAFGGPKPAVTVDGTAIDRAGQAGPWGFLRYYPVDGEPLVGMVGGHETSPFMVAGHAPVYLPNTDFFPEPIGPYWQVDEAAVDRAGQPGPFAHLRAQPADGTFLFGVTGATGFPIPTPVGTLYWTSGGAAVPVVDQTACHSPSIMIEDVAVARAGDGGVWNHLLPLPVSHPAPPC